MVQAQYVKILDLLAVDLPARAARAAQPDQHTPTPYGQLPTAAITEP